MFVDDPRFKPDSINYGDWELEKKGLEKWIKVCFKYLVKSDPE